MSSVNYEEVISEQIKRFVTSRFDFLTFDNDLKPLHFKGHELTNISNCELSIKDFITRQDFDRLFPVNGNLKKSDIRPGSLLKLLYSHIIDIEVQSVTYHETI